MSQPDTDIAPAEPGRTTKAAMAARDNCTLRLLLFVEAVMAQEMRGSLTVSPMEAHALLSHQGVTLLDVRGASDFQTRHISGAINVPMNQLEANLNALLSEGFTLMYCAAPETESALSVHVVRLLRAHGGNAFAIAGGLGAWVSHGFDTTAGQ